MRIGGIKVRVRGLALAAMLLALTAFEGKTGEREYKPVRVPVIPGVRQTAERYQAKRLKPYLANAGGDVLYASDLSSEVGRGGTNAAAALGNGGLSVEISPWAELTVMRWPSPLYKDQLRYYTLPGTETRPVRMDRDAPSPDWRRYGHPQDACPGLGSRGGILLAGNTTVWIGDPSWTTSRGFEPEDATVLVTRLDRPDATVAVSDYVMPDRDLLVRSFKITGPAKRFLYRATFAPQIPTPRETTDFDPDSAGFAAAYLAADQVIVNFQPRGKNPPALTAATASASALDAAYPEGGAFVAWGFLEPGSAGLEPGATRNFQVGADRCLRKVVADAPAGGYDDAADGRLSGNAFFSGPVNAALAIDLAGDKSAVTVLIAAADTAEKAVALIRAARAVGEPALRSKAVAYWQERSRRVRLPEAADPVTRRVIRRSVLNVLIGQDRQAGAIVASVSRQPPYHFDYPRDSAFFDLLLDLAGFADEVTLHHSFLERTQYRQTLGFSPVWMVNYRSPLFNPAGNWPQKISADGSSPTSFLINPCEIDETALTVWNFWRHERVLAEAARPEYIAKIKDSFARSADSLLDWVDLKKGWTKPATEDDSFPPDATLHGVSSTLTALAAACDAGPRWGLPAVKTDKYCQAARALRDGLRGRAALPPVLDRAGFRGLAWSLWPAPAFDDYTEPGAIAIKTRLAESIRRKASKEAPGFAYLGEEMAALAMADRHRNEYRALLEQAMFVLTHEVAFPGSDCYGEITVWGDYAGTGDLVSQQRTAIPHLWNGAVVYLAAIALYEPERLEYMRPPAP